MAKITIEDEGASVAISRDTDGTWYELFTMAADAIRGMGYIIQFTNGEIEEALEALHNSTIDDAFPDRDQPTLDGILSEGRDD